jgi:hypothetical protein
MQSSHTAEGSVIAEIGRKQNGQVGVRAYDVEMCREKITGVG